MPYITLSDQIKKLHNPQRSDTFIKRLRDAIREGDVDAASAPRRFELPKKFTKHGGEMYTRTTKDLIIDGTPEFEAWFARVNKELTPTRSNGKIKVTPETIEAGLVDFKALAAETRRKMGASFEKGQRLGKSRTGAKVKATPKKTKK